MLRKAVWLHHLSEFSSAQKVRDWVKKSKDQGFDILIPAVKNYDGLADYGSRIAPIRDCFKKWDPLAVAVAQARKEKIKLHAWFCLAHEGIKARFLSEHPELIARKLDGSVSGSPPYFYFICMAQQATQDYQFSLMEEVTKRYDVDGIHLDYIRIGDKVCYCSYCKEMYFKITKEKQIRTTDGWGKYSVDWLNWRAGRIEALVRRTRAMTRKYGKELSAAVFAGYPECVRAQGQDWVNWSQQGLLDYVFPMTYDSSPEIVRAWARSHVAHLQGADVQHWEGLGKIFMRDGGDLQKQLDVIVELGIPGVVLFSYPNLKKDDFKVLKKY